MNKVKDHYEKLILVVLVILLGYFSLTRILGGSDHAPEKMKAAVSLPYELDIVQGMAELTFKKIHSLMPGQEISIMEDNGSVKEKIRIEGIVLRRKANVQIFLTNGEMVEGRLSANDYAEMVTRCRAAECSENCAIWLSIQQSQAIAAPEFCANAKTLNELR